MASLEGLFKVRMSSKGQVVIPKHIRAAFDLSEGDELLLIPTKEGILIKHPSEESEGLRGLLKGMQVDMAECEAILREARRSLVRTLSQ